MTIRAHMTLKLRASLICIMLSPVAVLPAFAQPDGTLLSGSEIRSLVNGQRIYIGGPLGAELPVNYRTNGTVDGSGEAVGLGRFFQPKDKGRWWINGNQLCQQWEQWYNGTVMCFTLQRNGADKLIWKRDNGESGSARLARR